MRWRPFLYREISIISLIITITPELSLTFVLNAIFITFSYSNPLKTQTHKKLKVKRRRIKKRKTNIEIISCQFKNRIMK
jgi:hypothetical protein